MKAIYKYSLPVQEKHTFELPKGARIIRVEDVYQWEMKPRRTERNIPQSNLENI